MKNVEISTRAEHSSILESSITAVCDTEKYEMHTGPTSFTTEPVKPNTRTLTQQRYEFPVTEPCKPIQGRKCFPLLPNNYLMSSSLETSRSITITV